MRLIVFTIFLCMTFVLKASPFVLIETVSREDFENASLHRKMNLLDTITYSQDYEDVDSISAICHNLLKSMMPEIQLKEQYEFECADTLRFPMIQLPNSNISGAVICSLHQCELFVINSLTNKLLGRIYQPALLTDDKIIVGYPTGDCDTKLNLHFYYYTMETVEELFSFSIPDLGEPKEIICDKSSAFYISFFTSDILLKVILTDYIHAIEKSWQ